MPYSTWLAPVLEAEFAGDRDVTVHRWPGWETRGSSTANHQGVTDHDTGSRPGSTYRAVLLWCLRNSPIAPLCNYLTGPDWEHSGRMRVDVIAAGRTHHGGKPDNTWDPQDAWVQRSANTNSLGAEHFWTMDRRAWTARELEVQMRCDAAGLEHFGRGSNWQQDHKDYASGRKADRRYIHTQQWRRDLDVLLARRANPPKEDDDMPTANEVAEAVWAAAWGPKDNRQTAGERLAWAAAYSKIAAAKAGTTVTVDAKRLAGDIIDAMPAGMARQVADELHRRLAG